MGRASVTAVGFALAGGLAADTAHVAHVAPVPDQFGRVLLACVEPTELSPRGMELAGVALRALREAFATTAGTTADALVAAVSRLPGRSRLRLRLQPGLTRGAKRTTPSSAAGNDAGLSALVQTNT